MDTSTGMFLYLHLIIFGIKELRNYFSTLNWSGYTSYASLFIRLFTESTSHLALWPSSCTGINLFIPHRRLSLICFHAVRRESEIPEYRRNVFALNHASVGEIVLN